MSIISIALLILLVTVGIICVQNWSPALALVFLGSHTIELPLGMLILIAVIAGVVTFFLLASLFKLSNYLNNSERSPFIPQTKEPINNNPNSSWRNPWENTQNSSANYSAHSQNTSDNPSATNPPPKSQPSTTIQDDEDDDDFESDLETEEVEENPPIKSHNVEEASSNYETKQEPKSSSWSGSVYSYSYREPKNSGAGQTESVYDADYRVITPPTQPLTDNDNDWETNKNKPKKNNNDNDDDWGLGDEDDIKDEKPNKKFWNRF